MLLKRIICILIVLANFSNSYSQQGKNGNKTISTQNVIVNEYTSLTSDALANSSSITVANNNLNTNNRFTSPLSAGDLIMIIQVQGAIVNGSFYTQTGNTFGLPKDSLWGSILDINNCGNYEWREVSGIVSSTIIQLNCPLSNTYLSSGKTVIIRIPRYNNLTINNGSSITCDAWDGTKGGIIAIEAIGNVIINGSIQSDAKGFRGGATDNTTTPGSGDVASNSSNFGANRGEGIAGFGTDLNYVGGRFGKGTAANAGGGGTAQNAGGGGGANGGNVSTWNGYGKPSLATASWAQAWNLLFPNFSSNNSSGGGLGGYTASTASLNPLTNGPNNYSWSGDGRRNQGGYGGRPMDYSTGKIFMAGAGGAGDGDDNSSGRGGNAGGLIYLYATGNISGNGTIISNGENGANASGTPTANGVAGQDGAGGAGAGGTIIIDGTTNISGISCTANGGNGGNQVLTKGAFNFNNNWNVQAQGPGGGGSGGYIKVPINTITTTVSGGNNGTTNSASMVNFLPNGATSGGLGTVEQIVATAFSTINDTICPGNSAQLIASTNTVGTTIEWYDAAIGGNLLFTGSTFTTPSLNTNQTYYAQICPGFYRLPASAIIQTNSAIANAGTNEQICGNQLQLNANLQSGFTGQWSIISGSANFVDPVNPQTMVTNLGSGINTLRWTITDGNCNNGFADINIETFAATTIANAGNDLQTCVDSLQINGNIASIGNPIWTIISGTGTFTNSNNSTTTINNLSNGNTVLLYTINSTNAICPSSSDTLSIQKFPQPDSAMAGTDIQICSNSVTLNANNPTIGNGNWSIVSGSGIFVNATNGNTQVSGLSNGTNTFRWTISTANCGSSFDEINVSITNSPSPANAGGDLSICGLNTTLNAVAPSSGNGEWSSINSSISFSDINNPNATISNLQIGNNTIIWSVTQAGCPTNSDTIIINSTEPPSTANAGADQVICGTNTQLNGNTVVTGVAAWSCENANANFVNANLSNTQINFLQPGTYNLVYSISNGICPINKDSLDVEVNPALIANVGSDITSCNDTIQLQNQGNFGNISWSLFPSTFIGDILSPNQESTQIVFNATNSGTAVVQVSFPGCSTVVDSVKINLLTEPISLAGNDISTCSGSVQLNANLPSGSNGTWTNISNSFLPQQQSNPNTFFNYSDSGIVKLVWNLQIPSCPIARDTIKINFHTPNTQLSLSNDTTIQAGDTIILSIPGANNIIWETSEYLSCSNCLSVSAYPVNTSYFYVDYTDENNCIYKDSIEVKVEKTFYAELPTAFSPNQDGNNDFLLVRHNGLKTLRLEVFDEYGQMVFSINEGDSFDKKWDGNFKEKSIMPQVLVYTMLAEFIDGSFSNKKGKLLLLR